MLSLNYGTLYPALLKLEQEGAIAGEWGISENNRKARFYKLTRAGRKRWRRRRSSGSRPRPSSRASWRPRRKPHETPSRRARPPPAFLSRTIAPIRAFDAELESHLQLHIDDNLRAGMTPDEARRQAILKLGGIDRTRQAYRDQASAPVLEHLAQDLQFALRHLVKAPGFTVTAVGTMALGFGAALAIYAFADAALVEPLPYRDPARLVEVTERSRQVPHANMSHPDFVDWKRQQTVFSGFDVHNARRFSLSTPAGLVPVRGGRVSPGFFQTLGVTPVAGRDFHDGDDVPNGPGVAIISDAAWHTYFGARPDIVGQSATLDGTPSTIIGVLPSSFHFALRGPVEFWVPFRAVGPCETNRSCHNLLGVARLKDGVSIDDARAQMSAIAARLEREYPDSNRDQSALVGPLSAQIVGDIRPILLLLLSGAGAAAGDRLRQRRQPAARAVGGAQARACRQEHARRVERPADPSVRDGSVRARGAGRWGRPRWRLPAASGCCSASCPRTCGRGCRFSTRSA